METIRELLTKLDNKVTPTVAKKLDGMQALQAKLQNAKEEYEANPTDEKLADLEEIEEFMADENEEIIDDLKALIRRKRFTEEEQEKETQSSLKDSEAPKGDEASKDKEKSGLGVFGMVFGGVLLVASLGAINYFRNNR
jgi:predicted house-cleaning noncanonical NTP pyrophosphatase (MazG superfamily)